MLNPEDGEPTGIKLALHSLTMMKLMEKFYLLEEILKQKIH